MKSNFLSKWHLYTVPKSSLSLEYHQRNTWKASTSAIAEFSEAIRDQTGRTVPLIRQIHVDYINHPLRLLIRTLVLAYVFCHLEYRPYDPWFGENKLKAKGNNVVAKYKYDIVYQMLADRLIFNYLVFF